MRPLVTGVLGETVYRRLVLYERDLRAPAPPVDTGYRLSFSWLGVEQLDAYEALRPGHRGQAESRLARGHRCFATWLDGRLAAVRWLAAGAPRVEYLDMTLPLAEEETYHYDTFTDPTLRRRGVSAASQAKLFETLRAEGYRWSIRAVLPENHAAVRDTVSAGYRPRGSIGFVRVGRWKRELRRTTR